MSCIKDEIKIVCRLLQRYADKLSLNSHSKRQAPLNPDPSSTTDAVTTAFKNSLKTMSISDNEFHAVIDYAFSRKKKKESRRLTSNFAACVNTAVEHVISLLRGRKEYDPLFLTDEATSIEKFGDAVGENFLDSYKRAKFRDAFRTKLSEDAAKNCFHIYGKVNSGNNPDCIFAWRVLIIHGTHHAGSVAKAINECQQMAPKQMGREAVRHFNAIMNQISVVPAGARDALHNYLFLGHPDPDNSIADKYVQFVINLAAGQPLDENMFVDDRTYNSHGGNGVGATQYNDFWEACREVILPNSATEERRHSDIIYASGAHSIPNLIKLATEILQRKVDDGTVDKLPAIPSKEWVGMSSICPKL